MFDASAICLPSGEIAASSTAWPGVSAGVTSLPVLQSLMFGENGFLVLHSTMPCLTPVVGVCPKANSVLPSFDQWIEWPTLRFGTCLQTGASPDLVSAERHSPV